MNSIPVFVGLDYHQDSVQVCVLDQAGKRLLNRSVANDAAEIERLATRYGQPRRIAIEACCGAANLAEELATVRGLPMELAHPGYVNRMKRSADKTDFSDAHLLADLTRINYLPKVWPKGLAQRFGWHPNRFDSYVVSCVIELNWSHAVKTSSCEFALS